MKLNHMYNEDRRHDKSICNMRQTNTCIEKTITQEIDPTWSRSECSAVSVSPWGFIYSKKLGDHR